MCHETGRLTLAEDSLAPPVCVDHAPHSHLVERICVAFRSTSKYFPDAGHLEVSSSCNCVSIGQDMYAALNSVSVTADKEEFSNGSLDKQSAVTFPLHGFSWMWYENANSQPPDNSQSCTNCNPFTTLAFRSQQCGQRVANSA